MYVRYWRPPIANPDVGIVVISTLSSLRLPRISAAWHRESWIIESKFIPSVRSRSVEKASTLLRQSPPCPPGGWKPRPTVSPNATAIRPGSDSHMRPRSVPYTCQRLSVRLTDPAPVCFATVATSTTRGAGGAGTCGAGSIGGVSGAGGGGGAAPSPGTGMPRWKGLGFRAIRGEDRIRMGRLVGQVRARIGARIDRQRRWIDPYRVRFRRRIRHGGDHRIRHRNVEILRDQRLVPPRVAGTRSAPRYPVRRGLVGAGRRRRQHRHEQGDRRRLPPHGFPSRASRRRTDRRRTGGYRRRGAVASHADLRLYIPVSENPERSEELRINGSRRACTHGVPPARASCPSCPGTPPRPRRDARTAAG